MASAAGVAGSVVATALQAQQLLPLSKAPLVGQAPRWATLAAPLVFRGVTVIDVREGRRLAGQTVVVVGSRIQALGPAKAVRIPAGARVVDARGRYLIPGLWDMHIHSTTTGVAQPNAEHNTAIDIAYPLFIANGVTGVRDAGTAFPLATLGQWKREIAAGTRVGPRLFVAGPTVNGQSGGGDGGYGMAVSASTPEKMRRLIDSLHAAGADFIKTYGLTPALYFALAAEARHLRIPFGGHSPRDPNTPPNSGPEAGLVDGRVLSDSGARFLDHSDYLFGDNPCDGNPSGRWGEAPTTLNVEQCAAIGQRFRRNDTWVVMGPLFFARGHPIPARVAALLGHYVPDSLFGGAGSDRAKAREADLASYHQLPGAAFPPPTSTADWVAPVRRLDSLQGYVDTTTGTFRGWALLKYLPILAGTDVVVDPALPPPGFGLHDHLAMYVVRGMTPLQALQTATLNPALALHATDSLGTVAAGKVADLVLLDADPLTDIWNTTKIRAVVANGRYYDRAALDRVLADVERVAHR